MSQSLRNLKTRIRSIENTRKITRAMQMVASAKLSRVKSILYPARAYLQHLEEMLSIVHNASPARAHELARPKDDAADGVAVVCVATSDTGLCSTYNYTILRRAQTFLASVRPRRVRAIAVGREGLHELQKQGCEIAGAFTEWHGRYADAHVTELSKAIDAEYSRPEVSSVHFVYTRFGSTLKHMPVVEALLPLEIPHIPKSPLYLIEPERGETYDALVRAYVKERCRAMLLEASTSEHAARMIAMKSATDNADELLDTLTLMKNKVRQAAITTEVTEISMSAEALKG